MIMKLRFSVNWSFLNLTLLCLQIRGSKGCIEAESLALLQFKASFTGPYDFDLLPSWVDDPKSDCCEWERVTCNSSSRHVTELSLNNIRFDVGEENVNQFINITMLQEIRELRCLDLSYNQIYGFVENELGFANLKKLEILDIGSNCFNNTAMASVGTIASLKTLILGSNSIEGSFPIKELANLENLEVLDLSWNGLNTTLTIQDLGSFPKARKLKYLDLSRNQFNNNTLSFLSIFPALKDLGLSRTRFIYTETFSHDLCRLKKLEELDLSINGLKGNLPQCLQNLTSLRILNLSGNKFTGQLPSSVLTKLTFLTYIDLYNNLFEGSFSFQEFANHSFLEVVQFSDNNLKVVNQYPDWIPTFQLQFLSLEYCGLQQIPDFLFHQSKLEFLHLSHNNIKETFPNWLVKNNTGLRRLYLNNNSFSGKIHLLQNISFLDVSENNLIGLLKETVGKKFSNMKFLDLSGNHFQGEFPFSPDDDCKLGFLDLSYNNFTGRVPEKLVSSCIDLTMLKLSYNNFQGQIFTKKFNLTGLYVLQLNNNQFVGTLPSSIIRSFVAVLDVSNNCFYGEIPRWIGNFTNLFSLVLYNNFFTGSISCQHLSSLYVDLSHNSLSGLLPSCSKLFDYFGSPAPSFLNLQGNKLNGPISKLFLNSSLDLKVLDLSSNNFSGSISKSFGELSKIRIISLAANHINGFIPKWLCQLNKLKILDLSRNYFSGSIPHCLYNLAFGSQEDQSLYVIHFPVGLSFEKFYNGSLAGIVEWFDPNIEFGVDVDIEFNTKHMSYTYGGRILSYMSGLDLSDNLLTGEIPYEVGMLSQIRALNLSHNQLRGSIPKSFSNLSQIESLDLSFNNLSGQIPPEFVGLHFLEVFIVAHNNLSGRLPDMMKGQFITFNKSSYEGNPFLCGPPLLECNGNESASRPIPSRSEQNEKWYEIDRVVFFTSFSVSFFLFFVAAITVLYINAYWRHRLLYHCQEFTYSCYYFLYDNLFKSFR